MREARHPEPIIRPSLFRDARLRRHERRQHRRELRRLQRAAAGPLLSRAHRRPGDRPRRPGAGARRRRHGASASWLAGRLAAARRSGLLALAGIVLNVCGLGAISMWTPTTGFAVIAADAARPGRRRRAVPGRLYRSRHRDAAARGPRRRRQPHHGHPHHRRGRRRNGPLGGLSRTSRRRRCRPARARPRPSWRGSSSTFLWVAIGLALFLGAEPAALAHVALCRLRW